MVNFHASHQEDWSALVILTACHALISIGWTFKNVVEFNIVRESSDMLSVWAKHTYQWSHEKHANSTKSHLVPASVLTLWQRKPLPYCVWLYVYVDGVIHSVIILCYYSSCCLSCIIFVSFAVVWCSIHENNLFILPLTDIWAFFFQRRAWLLILCYENCHS